MPGFYWYQNDHLGTPHSLTDSQGNTVWRGQHSAYGQLTEEWTPPDAQDEHPQPKVNNPLRFQGQYEDAESGLYYNLNRYYDPGVGRYLTADPSKLAGGLNAYSYVDGNPVGWVDPLGLKGLPGFDSKSAGEINSDSIIKSPISQPTLPETKHRAKNTEEMTNELANEINKNSIYFSTIDKMGHIDLRGRTHFDKLTKTDIPTPHVQVSPKVKTPDGRFFPLKKKEEVYSATKADIRLARKLAKNKGV
ncbi:RHS repeat-associated core domain-containing protein [Serratia fonticola]|uniref:RHS repeat-associated core domain-containing protein n=1 Tax=Serratia fonticola TaxID=47917 RepID=A0AAJ2DCK3_SERFO|nr:RHS repeat-associated core domain-containing protein [Serratia fonticola]MDQ9127420.1 RHS repeat-associated core domain-containing protein [Serratia fonticola]